MGCGFRYLLKQEHEVHLVVTDPARIVVAEEMKWDMQEDWKTEIITIFR